MLRKRSAAVLVLGLGLVTAPGAPAQAASASPTTIQLPEGFQPEGVETGPGAVAYFSSMADGSIYRVNLRTGHGAIFSKGPGTPSLGMKLDSHGRLFVAGGTGGDVRVLDTQTGRVLARYQVATGPTFVNDIILTHGAAWITDSTAPVLYELPLRGGRLPAAPVRIPLIGDLKYQPGFNSNGITATPDGKGLLVVQSNTGGLFHVTWTGKTRRVNLHGDSLRQGDGLLLRGRTMYAVEGHDNAVAVLRLNAAGTDGHVVRRVTDRRFDVPSTVAAFGSRIYLPNARFNTTPTPTTPYWAIAIPRP